VEKQKGGRNKVGKEIDKRLIEVSFPVKEVSEISAKEKNIRHGHISTLHIWWARRPLASSRATSYAALIPAPENDEELKKKRRFIIEELAKWENSLNQYIMEKARKEIIEANGGKPPRVLDPFSGGGSIPLEAMRLGCETHAVEYNPVATLILKCTLEYPQKYGKRKRVEDDSDFIDDENKNPLLEDVKKWGEWVLKEAEKEIGKFYPKDEDGSIPLGYIWARTIPCQHPDCEAEIPLMRQFWLAKKDNKKVALYLYVEDEEIKFEIVGDGYKDMPDDFDPSEGTVSSAIATCPVCGFPVDDETTRELFKKGKAGERMVAVVLRRPGEKGKKYRLASDRDLDAFKKAEKYLEEKRAKLMDEWGIDPIPNEEIPSTMPGGIHTPTYGMNKWGDLFASRQKLALITFIEKVRKAYKNMLNRGYDIDYSMAVISYLGIAIDRIAIYQTRLGYWHNTRELVNPGMGRQALAMTWDYAESNIFNGNANWDSAMKWILQVISHLSQLSEQGPAIVKQASATEIPYSSNYFDAVFTDPPYYYSITYADLSDFFYVWLKRVVGHIFPDLFITNLTPKSKEIIEGKFWDKVRYAKKDKEWFEGMLSKSFKEIYRVLRNNGIAIIVYTHKSTEGWEAMINSLLSSGLVIIASWPIHTEMRERLMAKESAALASSIYFVCRKIEREEIGWLNEVKEEIKERIYSKLETLWQEGVSGADYFISAIGSAIEIFGRYEKVMDYEGNIVTADKLLEYVREIVTDYAVKQILHNGISAELSTLTRFYILWRWTYGEVRVHFDDARKLAQSTGIDLQKEWNKGFIKKEKEFIRVLGPQDRKEEELEESDELIDVLHKVLLLWRSGRKEGMKKVLEESGFGRKDYFYRVAQAISETMPNDSREKKLLDGFLSGKEKIIDEIRTTGKQGGLFE